MANLQNKVFKSYQNLKDNFYSTEICIDNVKGNFGISRRRIGLINNVRELINELEKVCILDPYNVYALQVISGNNSNLYILVEDHKKLSSCSQRMPWYTFYADEIQNDKLSKFGKADPLGSTREVTAINLISKKIGGNWKMLARCLKIEEPFVQNIEESTVKDYEKAKKCLMAVLNNHKPEEFKKNVLAALSRTRRNDIRKEVEAIL